MKSIICIILLIVLILLILNIKTIESFDKNNLSGKWDGEGLDSGPIIFEHKGNIVNATYPNIGAIVAIIDNKKITWRTQKTGLVILGEIISDKDGNHNSIKWENGITWNRVLEENKEHNLPGISIPDLSGKWWGPAMVHGSIKLTQKNNKVQGTYPKLGNGTGTIVNNRIIWVWGSSSVKTIGDIIIKNKKPVEIKWQNGFIWKIIKPAAEVAGEWTGSGLTKGPLIMLQHNNVVNAVYPQYGPMTGEIINNRIDVKWIFSGAAIGGNVIKNKNNQVEKIKWDNNLEWYFKDIHAKSNVPNKSNQSTRPNLPNHSNQPTKPNLPNQPTKQINANKVIKSKQTPIENVKKPVSNKEYLNINLKEVGMSLGDTLNTPLPPINLKDTHPSLTNIKESFVNQEYFISRGPAHIIR